MPKLERLPKLPNLLDRKLYKTGQTRGADDDEIYQNRVSRSCTVLIPFAFSSRLAVNPPVENGKYENGFIVLLTPEEYFDQTSVQKDMKSANLDLGKNALIFYETREHWNRYNPIKSGWQCAQQRTSPLGGHYVARVPAVTSSRGEKINHGFTSTAMKGAGIRIYEYASSAQIERCRRQLEALFWMCADAKPVVIANGMSERDAAIRKQAILDACQKDDLCDQARLNASRMINAQGHTICPLCLQELSGAGFLSRMEQAPGRDVRDLTVTQVSLFHINELRVGDFNHRPYNLGWGHHHCNVVVKDSGIAETLKWMHEVVQRNQLICPMSSTTSSLGE